MPKKQNPNRPLLINMLPTLRTPWSWQKYCAVAIRPRRSECTCCPAWTLSVFLTVIDFPSQIWQDTPLGTVWKDHGAQCSPGHKCRTRRWFHYCASSVYFGEPIPKRALPTRQQNWHNFVLWGAVISEQDRKQNCGFECRLWNTRI